MGGGKKQDKNSSKKDRKLSLIQYEKIGTITIKTDWWSREIKPNFLQRSSFFKNFS